MNKNDSEFGKGLVVCLLHFANHWSNKLWETIQDLEATRLGKRPLPDSEKGMADIYTTIENHLSSRITHWANGASDHLYEMEVPAGAEWSIVAKKVKRLKSIGLEIGHGYTGKDYVWADIELLITLSKEIAIEIDKLIGLQPDLGQWQ